jgi:hypothetical protein
MAIWPFSRKPVIDADTAGWHADNFAWLLRHFGGQETLTQTTLVLPKPGFFRFDGNRDHAFAQSLFEQVKTYCGMAEWDIDLIPDDNPIAELSARPLGMLEPQPQKHNLGTFSFSENRIQITYATTQLRQPDCLIATFAHELAHCLLATAREPLPCEDDEIEFLTDLAAVYLGFGVFLANTRFAFEGSNEGWRFKGGGYLPEADLIFALGLFLRAKKLDPDAACAALKPHLAKLLKRAVRDLSDQSAYVAQLSAALTNAAVRPNAE